MVKTAGKGLANKTDRTPEEDDMLDMMVNVCFRRRKNR